MDPRHELPGLAADGLALPSGLTQTDMPAEPPSHVDGPFSGTNRPRRRLDALRAQVAPGTLAVGYLLAFFLLDWVSFIRPYQGLNITPWNPHPALAIALLIRRPRWTVLVWLSLLAADGVVRGWPNTWFVTIASTAALSLAYSAMASLLRQHLNGSMALFTRRDLSLVAVIAVGGALLCGSLYVATLSLGGPDPEVARASAIARYWIGDAVGTVVTLPMLFAVLDETRRAELARMTRTGTWWAIAAVVLLLLALTFGRLDHEPFKFFYMLFVPMVWAATRLGLAGAVLASALTQVGLIVAVQSVANSDLTVFELQVLMAALTMTGLLLGVTVDERRIAESRLSGSLRMAAAGQMAAALAHELSQPLTALNSYAQAARSLTRSRDLPIDDRLAKLTHVAEKMAADAIRASDVVKRLRDFFRAGSTQLQTTGLDALIVDAIREADRRATIEGVRIDIDMPEGVEVIVDRVQIAVVLRNLLANALDACAGTDQPRHVSLRVARRADDVLIEIRDSGPGVNALQLGRVFEAGISDKPGGMGIGLSICRAIVEAHGGRLWAVASTSGVFCLTLPADASQQPIAEHAP